MVGKWVIRKLRNLDDLMEENWSIGAKEFWSIDKAV